MIIVICIILLYFVYTFIENAAFAEDVYGGDNSAVSIGGTTITMNIIGLHPSDEKDEIKLDTDKFFTGQKIIPIYDKANWDNSHEYGGMVIITDDKEIGKGVSDKCTTLYIVAMDEKIITDIIQQYATDIIANNKADKDNGTTPKYKFTTYNIKKLQKIYLVKTRKVADYHELTLFMYLNLTNNKTNKYDINYFKGIKYNKPTSPHNIGGVIPYRLNASNQVELVLQARARWLGSTIGLIGGGSEGDASPYNVAEKEFFEETGQDLNPTLISELIRTDISHGLESYNFLLYVGDWKETWVQFDNSKQSSHPSWSFCRDELNTFSGIGITGNDIPSAGEGHGWFTYDLYNKYKYKVNGNVINIIELAFKYATIMAATKPIAPQL